MDNQLGKRIKARRMALNMRQSLLAKLSGITQAQISRYESGQAEPVSGTLVVIAKVLGISTDWLLGLSDDEESPEAGKLNEYELEAIIIMRSKPPEKQADIVEILRRI